MINDGLVEAYKKLEELKKGDVCLVGYAEERMENPEENEIIILDTDAPEKVEILEKMLRDKVNPKGLYIVKLVRLLRLMPVWDSLEFILNIKSHILNMKNKFWRGKYVFGK